jgi:cobyrinic acid a,c-diamide synthase
MNGSVRAGKPRVGGRLVVAGTASGVGKTTVASAVIRGLVLKGLDVAPFKVGPDYIDPSYHTLAAGKPSRNLDSWLIPHDYLRALFSRAASEADLAVIEGVMGLYDGRSGEGEAGSTAEVAKLLNAPTVLVLDIGMQARSAAAVALGFQAFDRDVPLVGFILNRAGSDRHGRLARQEVEAATGLPVLGILPKQSSIALPERHLGLVPTAESAQAGAVLERLAEMSSNCLDVDGLLRIATAVSALPEPESSPYPVEGVPQERGLAVAMDEAFSFYYQDNLDLLRAYGAELLPFSPLAAEELPSGARGLYLGGGFPELYAQRLAANRRLLERVRQAAADGLPIYAECGGLMYLAEGLTDFDGQRHQLSGVIPCEVEMSDRRSALGYVKLRSRCDTLLSPARSRLRGHEFHWSRLTAGSELVNAYDVLSPSERVEGFARGNVLASYVHLHFGAAPELARRFVEALI